MTDQETSPAWFWRDRVEPAFAEIEPPLLRDGYRVRALRDWSDEVNRPLIEALVDGRPVAPRASVLVVEGEEGVLLYTVAVSSETPARAWPLHGWLDRRGVVQRFRRFEGSFARERARDGERIPLDAIDHYMIVNHFLAALNAWQFLPPGPRVVTAIKQPPPRGRLARLAGSELGQLVLFAAFVGAYMLVIKAAFLLPALPRWSLIIAAPLTPFIVLSRLRQRR